MLRNIKSNSFFFILFYITFTFWTLNFSNAETKEFFTEYNLVNIPYAYPLLTILILSVLLFIIHKEVKIIKLEQLKKDCYKSTALHQQEKENIINQLRLIEIIANHYNVAIAEAINLIIKEFGNKLTLTKLDYPELAIVLLRKTTEAKVNHKISFEYEIEDNLKELNEIPSTTIEKIFDSIYNYIFLIYQNSNNDNRNVSCLIRKEDDNIIFDFAFCGRPIYQMSSQNIIIERDWEKTIKVINKNKGKLELIQTCSENVLIRLSLPSKIQKILKSVI